MFGVRTLPRGLSVSYSRSSSISNSLRIMSSSLTLVKCMGWNDSIRRSCLRFWTPGLDGKKLRDAPLDVVLDQFVSAYGRSERVAAEVVAETLGGIRRRVWYNEFNNVVRQMDTMARKQNSAVDRAPEAGTTEDVLRKYGEKIPSNKDVLASEAVLLRDERFGLVLQHFHQCIGDFNKEQLLSMVECMAELRINDKVVWKALLERFLVLAHLDPSNSEHLGLAELTNVVHWFVETRFFPQKLVARLSERIAEGDLREIPGEALAVLLQDYSVIELYDAPLFRRIRTHVERNFDDYSDDDVYQLMCGFNELGFPVRMLKQLVSKRGVFD